MPFVNALITGASSGIGRGLALRLAADGAAVILCARREHLLSEAAQEIIAAGGRARVLPLDVTDTARTVDAIRQVDEEVGGLDLIVANAGMGERPALARMTWETIAPMLSVNFNGAIATLTAVLPRMLARRRGHLVAVSSLAAVTPLPTGAPYCASKRGLSTFVEALRLDLKGSGVRVTTVQPGAVKTPMMDKAKKPPPLLMPCAKAVDLIVRKLPRAPAVIEFPLPISAMLHTLARLPRPLRDAAVRRFPVPEEDGG